MYDNALSSQNQDYLPSRFILQKEIIDRVITEILEDNRESLIGLVPLAQELENDILTPTKNRPYLSKFLYESDLMHNTNHSLCLYQVDQSLRVSELTDKCIIIFLSTEVPDVDELLSDLYALASRGIMIYVVCFGDCIALSPLLKSSIDLENFHCICLENDDDFNEKVMQSIGGSPEPTDPELEEAIRRSLQEK